jgi:hypothetical protein
MFIRYVIFFHLVNPDILFMFTFTCELRYYYVNKWKLLYKKQGIIAMLKKIRYR